MRIVYFSTFWTVIIDIIAWTVIHLGVVYAAVRIPIHRFNPSSALFRSRQWERCGKIYQDLFKIKKWKKYLPDAAPFLGERGFPKKKLEGRRRPYLELFVLETCRAELVHWSIILFAPFFFLWNPLGVGFIMIFYAAAENLPLVMAQRYNRLRFKNILDRPRQACNETRT